jgi:hypothetical protein
MRTTTATATPRPSRPAGTARPAPARPRLALVRPVSGRSPKAPFVVMVVALLVAGLAGLLFLHTALAEDSFRLHDLQQHSAALADREQALEQQVALDASPLTLTRRAQALGMVRSENPAFIRLSDSRILGKPKAGVAPPPPPKPSPKASGRPSPTASPSSSAHASSSPSPSVGRR